MPLYPHECDCGFSRTVLSSIEMRDAPVQCACGLKMLRVIAMPTIQTISTHMGGKSDGQGYFDTNLRDKNGNPTYITDLGQKRRELQARGLRECGDDMSLPGAAKRRDDERNERRQAVTFAPKRSSR
jgi:predicted nucleic acid-binding Zn ribbon protein